MADFTMRNSGRTALLWAGGLALAGAAGAGLYLGAAHTVDVEAQARFGHLARTSRQHLDGAVRSYADVVRGLGGLFQANGGTVTRLQFHRYVEALGVAEHYPAIESVNYAAYVEEGARDAFVAAVRNDRSLAPDGYPDFAIRPAGHRPSSTVLTSRSRRWARESRRPTSRRPCGERRGRAAALRQRPERSLPCRC